jgi:hypothetical protein
MTDNLATLFILASCNCTLDFFHIFWRVSIQLCQFIQKYMQYFRRLSIEIVDLKGADKGVRATLPRRPLGRALEQTAS